MKIAICDDSPVFCQQLIDLIRQEQQETEQYEIQTFHNGEMLLRQYKEQHPFDLIFLDIEMGQGLSGMETAMKIRQQDQDVMLVFVTAHASFVFDAFDVQAMQYFVKPIEPQQFQRLFQRCRRRYYDEEYRLPFRIRSEKGQEEWLLLMVKDILYIESYLRKLQVHTVYGRSFEVAGKISEMEQQLSAHGFIRTHKSYLINLRYLYLLESDQLVMETNAGEKPVTLPLSRRKREQVKQALLQYKLQNFAE